jgi:hypothetical protein
MDAQRHAGANVPKQINSVGVKGLTPVTKQPPLSNCTQTTKGASLNPPLTLPDGMSRKGKGRSRSGREGKPGCQRII